jgi:hypothetical protein
MQLQGSYIDTVASAAMSDPDHDWAIAFEVSRIGPSKVTCVLRMALAGANQLVQKLNGIQAGTATLPGHHA